MATHTSLASLFTDIADAIRGKTGGSAQLVADSFPTAIAGIPSINFANKSFTPSSNSQSISITGLSGSPKIFALIYSDTSTDITSSSRVAAAWKPSPTSDTMYILRGAGSSSSRYYVQRATGSFSYSNGTLTINSGNSSYTFSKKQYQLMYAYE